MFAQTQTAEKLLKKEPGDEEDGEKSLRPG